MKQLCVSTIVTATLSTAALAQPSGFPDYNGIVQQMTAAANNFPAICQLFDLNATYGTPLTVRGNRLYAVKISDNVGQEEDEPSVMIVSAHHGNEYGTPIVALDTISRLTNGYGVDPEITRLVDDNEIWVAPVWNPDGYWRSRTNGNGIDLNRNYPFLWSSRCNTGIKGRAPASEPETQAMVAWSEDQRFTKVLDFHSSGRETLWGYVPSCGQHVLGSYLQAEAIALSNASSYGGRNRGPSSNGEHYQWQLGNYSNYAFLTEISTTQSPSISSAQSEATRLWPGTVWFIQRPIPVSGHVTDATSGAPIQADIRYVENPFTLGEQNRSEPRFGRYHAFLPTGTHTLRVSHPCYITQDVRVNVTASGAQVEIKLARAPGFVLATATPRNGSGVNMTCLSSTATPSIGQDWPLQIDTTGLGRAQFAAVVATTGAGNGPVVSFGEVLIDPFTPLLFSISAPAGGNPVQIGVPVPASTGLFGLGGTVQAVVGNEMSLLGLCNALDFTIGC